MQLFVRNNYGECCLTVYDFQVLSPARDGGIVSLLEGSTPATIVDFSSQAYNAYRPGQMLDENLSSRWQTSNNATTDQFATVDLAGRVWTIAGVRLHDCYGLYGVRDFEVRVATTTTDTAAFTTVFTGTAAANNELQGFTFAPVEARYVQLFVRDGHLPTIST